MRTARIMGLIAVLCLGCSAFADTLYNINFYRLVTEYSGAGAVGEAGDYWNFISANVAASSTKQYALNDSTNNTSSLVLDTTGMSRTGWSDSTQTNAVLEDYWSTGIDLPQSLAITGLNDSYTYDIYVFSESTSHNKPVITIDGVSQQAVSSTTYSTFVLNENYVVFEDVSPTSGSITISADNPTLSSPVCGFQIVESVPEPATMFLLASGGLFALIRKNRR